MSKGTDLDLRGTPKPQRHPRIYAAFEALAVGESFVLVNDHDPLHLREQMERDLAGSFRWDYQRREPEDWRIELTRTASTPLPRLVLDTTDTAAAVSEPDVTGAAWRLQAADRELDANLIALPPDDGIAEHAGADVDVLLHVVAGSGTLRTEGADVPLQIGGVVYLPRRARRAIAAGPDGLQYLSVHRRKETLPLMPSRRTD